jgi:hypothetical protein
VFYLFLFSLVPFFFVALITAFTKTSSDRHHYNPILIMKSTTGMSVYKSFKRVLALRGYIFQGHRLPTPVYRYLWSPAFVSLNVTISFLVPFTVFLRQCATGFSAGDSVSRSYNLIQTL